MADMTDGAPWPSALDNHNTVDGRTVGRSDWRTDGHTEATLGGTGRLKIFT